LEMESTSKKPTKKRYPHYESVVVANESHKMYPFVS